MKLPAASDQLIPAGKTQTRRKTTSRTIAPLIALTFLLTIPLYYPYLGDYSFNKINNKSQTQESFEQPIIKNTDNNPCSVVDGADSSLCDNKKSSGDVVRERRHEAPAADGRKRHGRGKREKKQQSTQHTRPRIRDDGDDDKMIRSKVLDYEKCDLFSGEWVANPEGPHYTNETCFAIQEHQNCMKYGRPDTGYLKWRWKPDDCELNIFDPFRFLELVRGKSLAFVGDSVARNHMQSLICLLSGVAYPTDLSDPADQNKRYEYREHDFNISMFWSPYLVKTGKLDREPFDLYLDEFNEQWTTQLPLFDYVIISAGHWFFRPTYFHVNNHRVGCLYCPDTDISRLTSVFSYRRAFRTAFRAINDAAGYKGVTFLRTFAPSHFEGGPWDRGGNCVRTKPFKRSEAALKDYTLEMYLIQLEELRIAQKAGGRNGGKFRLFDATKPMLLRPDGHPSKYGHWPVANKTIAQDCVHWCLPGPIDSWNDILQELLRREIQDNNR